MAWPRGASSRRRKPVREIVPLRRLQARERWPRSGPAPPNLVYTGNKTVSITRKQSYWACYWSCLRVAGLLDEDTLFGVRSQVVPQVYLWTFTFPDPATRCDAAAASAKWRRLSDVFRQRGWVFLWVLEQGDVGKGWHYHAVTRQFWPVTSLRPIAERKGFGRVNVRPVPAERATYVGKYVGKNFAAIESGVRRWGCVGFNGILTRNITIESLTFTNVTGCDGVENWLYLPPSQFTRSHIADRFARVSGETIQKHMPLKPHQHSVVDRLCDEGHTLLVGEYRGCEAVVKKVNAYEGGKIVGKVSRIVVTHHIENLRGQGADYRERQPDPLNREDGVDVTKEIKPPCAKGELCAVIVSGMSDKYGNDSGGIFNLTLPSDVAKK